jgi:hypothetical protein
MNYSDKTQQKYQQYTVSKPAEKKEAKGKKVMDELNLDDLIDEDL